MCESAGALGPCVGVRGRRKAKPARSAGSITQVGSVPNSAPMGPAPLPSPPPSWHGLHHPLLINTAEGRLTGTSLAQWSPRQLITTAAQGRAGGPCAAAMCGRSALALSPSCPARLHSCPLPGCSTDSCHLAAACTRQAGTQAACAASCRRLGGGSPARSPVTVASALSNLSPRPALTVVCLLLQRQCLSPRVAAG